MKRNLFITIFILAILGGCTSDELISPYAYQHISEELYVSEPTGIKLENYIVEEEVNINIKLQQDGTHRIKILDIGGTTVSQEKIDVYEGDNILKVYVKALPASSYTVAVLNENGNVIGTQIFSKQ